MYNGFPMFFFKQWFHYVCTTTLCSILLHHSAVFCMCFSPMCTWPSDACSSERQWGVSFCVFKRPCMSWSDGIWLALCAGFWELSPSVMYSLLCIGREWPCGCLIQIWIEWIGFVNWMDALSINELWIQDTLMCPREKSAASFAWAEGLPLVSFRFCKLFVWKVKKFLFWNEGPEIDR